MNVGTAFVEIRPDAAGFGPALNREVGRSARNASTKFAQDARAGFKRAGSVAGAAFSVGLGLAIRSAITEVQEAETVMRQTNAVIESTGGVAGVSAGHILELSSALSDVAAVDDEVIQGGANVLLTFKNIKAEGGVFDRALASTTDLAAHPMLGGDMAAAARMVGRALNDPLKGLTALTRAGVGFSAAQKSQIEQMVAFGNTAGAQEIILAELESQLGGTAEANVTATARMSVAWGNLAEQLGTLLVPALEMIATTLEDVTSWFTGLPEPMQQVVAIAGGLTVAFIAMWAALGGPATIAIAALITTGATIYGVWLATQPLRDAFFAVLDAVRNLVSIAWGPIQTAITTLIAATQRWWAMSEPVRSVLSAIGGLALQGVRTAIAAASLLVRGLWSASGPAREVLAAIGRIALGVLKAAISAVADHVRDAWHASAPLRDALSALGRIGLGVVKGALNAIASALQTAKDAAHSLQNALNSIHVPSLNIPGFASGGFLAAGRIGIVGENGPELAIGGMSGTRIIPNVPAGLGALGAQPSQVVVHNHLVATMDGQKVAYLTDQSARRDDTARFSP